MNILLIQPSGRRDDGITDSYRRDGRLKRQHFSGMIALPPLGLMYLATPIAQAGHSVRILDAATLDLTIDETVQEVIEAQPDVVGISLYSYYLKSVYPLTCRIKAKLPGTIIMLGGPHPTAMPEQVIAEFDHVNALVRGWGEFSIREVLDHFAGRHSGADIPGLCYRHGGTTVMSPPAPLPRSEAEVPLPHREALKEMYDNQLYYNVLSPRRHMDVLLTSRGCQFRCKFCFQQGRYFEHSPERVMQEIRAMASRGIDAIEIMDDSFTLNRKRADAIIDQIIAENLGIEFRIRSRVTAVDDALLARLKQMGCRAINFGMESGCDEMLALMNKRTKVAQNEAACRLTKKHDILCQTSWVFGYPGETDEMRHRTLSFVKRTLPNTFGFYHLAPFPSTKVYNEAKANGTLVGDWSVKQPTPHVSIHDGFSPVAFQARLRGEQRKLMLSPRFVVQTLRYLVRNPNARLFTHALALAVGKFKRLY